MLRVDVDQLDLLNPALRLQFSPSLCLIERDRSTLQIGSDSPYCVVVHNAPPGSVELLKALDGQRATHQILLQLSERYRVDPASWTALLLQLTSSGFVTVKPSTSHPHGKADTPCARADHDSLAIRHGPEMALQAMRNRREAVIHIVGAGRVAASIASMLAGAGIGHIYIEPGRPLRPTDICAAGVGQRVTIAKAIQPAALSSDSSGGRKPVSDPDSPTRASRPNRAPKSLPAPKRPAGRDSNAEDNDGKASAGQDPINQDLAGKASESQSRPRQRLLSDRLELAEVVHRVAPLAAVHPPGGYVPPNVVVLAGDAPPDSAALEDLHQRGIPHLAVQTTELSAAIGPFVIPGRTSCVNCANLYRTDRDPGWPLVLLALRSHSAIPPSALTAAVSAAAAEQVLQHVDRIVAVDTINGTLEWAVDSWQIRRRSWQNHPACHCRS